jgi:hypothetical protein
MKKIFIALCILAVAMLNITSCKKSDTPKPDQIGKDYIVEQGMVKFSSFDTYRNFLDKADDKAIENFVAYVKSNTSYKPLTMSTTLKEKWTSKKNSDGNSRLVYGSNSSVNDDIADLLSDNFLATMINSDGLVTIGNYIFNIDLVNEKCYAIHTSLLTGANGSANYNLIYTANVSSNYVFSFTTDDDVLDRLEEWSYPVSKTNIVLNTSRLFCREGGARGEKAIGGIEYFKSGHAKCKAVYQKAGIYFALFGKIKVTDYFDIVTPATKFRSRYEWRFKPKCWNERIQPYTVTNYDNNDKIYAWQSTRALNKYEFSIQWDIDYHGIEQATTRVYYIEDGY